MVAVLQAFGGPWVIIPGPLFKPRGSEVDPQTVLDRHRDRMIKMLKNVKASSQGNTKLRRFCDRVYDDLDQVTDTPATRDYLPGEELFLWCHNELLELAEVERPAPPNEPYLADMIARLRDFGGRLERNEPLPPGFAIHWLEDLDDDECAVESNESNATPTTG